MRAFLTFKARTSWFQLNAETGSKLKHLISPSLQSRRNFGERVLSIFLTKIMAATFDFHGNERLWRERNLYQGSGCRSKIRRGVAVGK